MKSKEFYKQMNDLTKDQFTEFGFTKLKGSVIRWEKERENDRLFIEIRNGKYPWEEYSGGNFTINCHCCPLSTPYTDIEEIEHTVSCFDYLSDQEYSSLTQLNSKVFDKVKAIDLSALGYTAEEIESYKDMHESICEDIEYDISSNSSRTVVNPPLYYLDEEDINQWAIKTKELLKIIVPAMDTDVKFSFSKNA